MLHPLYPERRGACGTLPSACALSEAKGYVAGAGKKLYRLMAGSGIYPSCPVSVE